MATTYGTTSASKSGEYDMSLWYDSKYYKIGLITMLLVAIFCGIKGHLRIQFQENILQQTQVIYLYSDHDHDRVEKRMEICRELFEKKSNPIIDIVAQGASLLEQYYYLINLTDWISYFLARENNVDPDPVTAIDYLKAQLAKVK